LLANDEQKSLIDSITSSAFLPEKYAKGNTTKQQLCPPIESNPLLLGHIGQATLLIEELEEWEVEEANTDLEPGGRWKPQNCTARHKVSGQFAYFYHKSTIH
jgi:hypothetical protein